ncbi:MAG: hypothetical protein ACRCX8_12505 [Sarcina sp.]
MFLDEEMNLDKIGYKTIVNTVEVPGRGVLYQTILERDGKFLSSNDVFIPSEKPVKEPTIKYEIEERIPCVYNLKKFAKNIFNIINYDRPKYDIEICGREMTIQRSGTCVEIISEGVTLIKFTNWYNDYAKDFNKFVKYAYKFIMNRVNDTNLENKLEKAVVELQKSSKFTSSYHSMNEMIECVKIDSKCNFKLYKEKSISKIKVCEDNIVVDEIILVANSYDRGIDINELRTVVNYGYIITR